MLHENEHVLLDGGRDAFGSQQAGKGEIPQPRCVLDLLVTGIATSAGPVLRGPSRGRLVLSGHVRFWLGAKAGAAAPRELGFQLETAGQWAS